MAYKDPEKVRECNARYYARNKEALCARQKNSPYNLGRYQRLKATDYIKHVYRQKRASAKSGGQEFTIKLEDLRAVWVDVCPILGKPLIAGDPMLGYSIDRIDSSKGYVPGNIEVISARANRMKSDATIYGMQRFAQGIINRYGLPTT